VGVLERGHEVKKERLGNKKRPKKRTLFGRRLPYNRRVTTKEGEDA